MLSPWFPLFFIVPIIVFTVVMTIFKGKNGGGRQLALTDPMCAACGYDVRTTLASAAQPRRCPECGPISTGGIA